MRIGIVLDSLNRGGAERQAVYATGELARNGYDVELIYYNVASFTYDASILPPSNVVRLAKEGKQLRFLWMLQRYFRKRRFDVVHGWMSVPGIYVGLAGRLAGIPVVFAGMRCEYDGTGMVQRAHRFVNNLVTGWIVNSKATVPSMVKGVGADPAKVHVVYNGIDAAAFSSKLSKPDAKAKLGVSPEAPTVSIIGRLRAQKNHPLFIEMAALTVKRVPNARFLVVGDGDGDEQQQLETQADRLGVCGQILFLGSRSDVPDILAATDVVMLTSHYEGVSNSLLEAMAVGLPVVSTAYAGVEELITDGHDGLIAPMGDAPALAAQVSRLLLDSGLRKSMGERGRETIRERFSMPAMGKNLYAVYRSAFEAAGK